MFAADSDPDGPLIKTVQIDYEHGIRQAGQHSAALGHRRKTAIEKCLKEIDLRLLPEMFVNGDHTIEAGIKVLSVLAAMPDPPSAVLCSNDMTAIGVM